MTSDGIEMLITTTHKHPDTKMVIAILRQAVTRKVGGLMVIPVGVSDFIPVRFIIRFRIFTIFPRDMKR